MHLASDTRLKTAQNMPDLCLISWPFFSDCAAVSDGKGRARSFFAFLLDVSKYHGYNSLTS